MAKPENDVAAGLAQCTSSRFGEDAIARGTPSWGRHRDVIERADSRGVPGERGEDDVVAGSLGAAREIDRVPFRATDGVVDAVQEDAELHGASAFGLAASPTGVLGTCARMRAARRATRRVSRRTVRPTTSLVPPATGPAPISHATGSAWATGCTSCRPATTPAPC